MRSPRVRGTGFSGRELAKFSTERPSFSEPREVVVKIKFAVFACLLAAGVARAGDPVASGLPAGYSFSEYSGPAAVGEGLVDTSNVAFFIDERSVAGIKSWYVFFDPERTQSLTATFTFDTAIVDVLDTKASLDASNATYGIDVDGDGVFDDYGTSLLIAPERGDATTWSVGGNTVSVDWLTADPGDHIRVLTLASAVPEPETWALLVAGVAALAWRARRTTVPRASRR